MKNIGVILVALGLVLIIVGLTLNHGILPWGRLPGDIRIVRTGMSFYFPVTSCVLISLAASIILMLMRHFR